MGCLLSILLVPVSLAALVTMAFLFAVIPDSGSPVTAANAARLKAGMTYEQVVEIVGKPSPPGRDEEDQATFCRDGIDTCSWSRCELCDNQLFLTFERGVLVAERSQGL